MRWFSAPFTSWFHLLIARSSFLSYLFPTWGGGTACSPPCALPVPPHAWLSPPQLPCKEKPSLSSWAAASCLGREAEGAPSGSLCTQQPQRCHSWPCGAERLRDHRIPSWNWQWVDAVVLLCPSGVGELHPSILYGLQEVPHCPIPTAGPEKVEVVGALFWLAQCHAGDSYQNIHFVVAEILFE